MSSALRLRITLLLSAFFLTACSLDPQPEPPLEDMGMGGSAGFNADASAAGGAAGSIQGHGGQGQSGSAGSAGASPMDASSDVGCTGDNCFCDDADAACDAGCEGGDADTDAECGTDAEGGADPDADQDAAPGDDGAADDALEPESGP